MDSMSRQPGSHDRLLLLAISTTAFGILSSLGAEHDGFGGAVACVGYGLTCMAIHRIGRQGRATFRS